MSKMNLLDLPDSMIEQIFEYLSYDEIARKRLICKRIDKVCQQLLNIGFGRMIKRHSKDLKRIKSLLPRRESERRSHPLARHADILTCIETRISMLSMTYSKYIESSLCCFIPGKVIDEVFRILRLIESTSKPLRAHEVLQELRDISSMAIEHFDEKISHLLRRYINDVNCQSYPNGINPHFDDGFCISNHASTIGIMNPTKWREIQNRTVVQKLEQKLTFVMKKANRMSQIQKVHTRQLRQNAVLFSEMNSQIIELKRRLEEADAKNREISANISQITGEPNPGGGSNNTSGSSSSSSVNLSTERTTRNIKPRVATTILKRRIIESPSSNEINDISRDLIKKSKLDD